MFKHKKLYYFTLFLFYQYFFITALLMGLYDGGNYFNPDNPHFVLNQNYLSDLGRTVTFNGLSNPNHLFYTLTLCLTGFGVMLFFILTTNNITSRFKPLVIFIGIVSGISYIGIAINPVDTFLSPHLFYGRLSFLAFFIASIGLHILLDKNRYSLSNLALLILNVLMFLYILLLFFGPASSSGVWALQLKTIAQKIIVYTLLTSCIFILLEHFKKLKTLGKIHEKNL